MNRNSWFGWAFIALMAVAGVVWWKMPGQTIIPPVIPTSTPQVEESEIRLDALNAQQSVTSPLTIFGQARGTWFFEASFPITIVDQNGAVLAITIAEAQGDWMTENFVPFKATVFFTVTTTQPGEIIFRKDNPSGLPEHDREWRLPVTLQAPQGLQRTVKLFYYNPLIDQDKLGNSLCGKQGLISVERQIPFTNTPVQDAVKALLRGEISFSERQQGVTTEFPLSGVELTGAVLNGGVLTLEFADPNNKTSGGSCRAGVLWAQIEATTKQFPEVKQVQFKPEYLFQP